MTPAAPYTARACGVDFGTSNSTAGWLRPGASTLLALDGDDVLLPSVVFFDLEEDRVVVGTQALAAYLAGGEGRLMRSLKSLLGSRLMDGHTEVGGRLVTFRALLTHFLRGLRGRAERAAGRGFDTAVFGRPVRFVDDDDAADRKAQDTLAALAAEAGFGEVSFELEPIAAAYHHERTLEREALVLIADIGGGTSDFSLLRLGPDRAERSDRRADVLACAGVHVGGTDFDRQLSLAEVMPAFGMGARLANGREMPVSVHHDLATWHTINRAYARPTVAMVAQLAPEVIEPIGHARLTRLLEARDGHWLAMQVEAAKIALSSAASHALRLDRIEPGFAIGLARRRFESASAALLDRIGGAVEAVVRAAGVRPDAIDSVYLTGGAGGMPALRRAVLARLPQARVVEGDTFGSIGAGLAVAAARRYGPGSGA